MFQKMKLGMAAFLVALVSLVSAPAMATTSTAPDVTAVVTAITDGAGPVAAIGGAVLILLVGIKIYKWVRRAM